jgi:hypothetical protein
MEEMIHPCIYLKVIWKSIPKHVKCKKITNHPNIFKTTYSKFLMKMRCPLIDGFLLVLKDQEVKFTKILLELLHGTPLFKDIKDGS